MEKKLRCASFFAGVGGIDLGFEETQKFEVVFANEFDEYPVRTYESNFPNVKVTKGDIGKIDPSEVPDVDVIFGGFPCQAFSIAGYRKGFDDEKGRGTLFFEMFRIIKEKQPKVVFAENVKNLLTHDGGNTYRVIKEALESEGYHVTETVLNAMSYGNVPQNRERIYIVAFKDEEALKRFHFPEPVELTKKLSDVIDFENKVGEKYYYTKGRYKDDIYNALVEGMDDVNAVYQWRRRYVRKNKSGVVPTLTANMGEGGHNVPIVKTKYGIRKMTPKECFNTQGFPKDFVLPEKMSDARLYKQAGNSVCVSVIRAIAENIAKALEKESQAYECPQCKKIFRLDDNNETVSYCPFCGSKIDKNTSKE